MTGRGDLEHCCSSNVMPRRLNPVISHDETGWRSYRKPFFSSGHACTLVIEWACILDEGYM